jgi:hypothetical protein
MAEYAWSETDAINRRRLCAIAGGLDPGTVQHLERLGVGEGWNCVEIGAGVGTIAGWLAGRVGPSRHVIATDLDVRWMADLESSGVGDTGAGHHQRTAR